MYSPTLGRFLQTDPIGYEDQFNLYAYVGNDPINGVDPSGLCSSSFKDDASGNCGVGDKYGNSTLIEQKTVDAKMTKIGIVNEKQLDSLSSQAAQTIQKLTDKNGHKSEYGYDILHDTKKGTLTTRVWQGESGKTEMPLRSSDGSRTVLKETGHTHNGMVAVKDTMFKLSQKFGIATDDRPILGQRPSPDDRAVSRNNIAVRGHFVYERRYEGWGKIGPWRRVEY